MSDEPEESGSGRIFEPHLKNSANASGETDAVFIPSRGCHGERVEAIIWMDP
jgi:hypothetical protein